MFPPIYRVLKDNAAVASIVQTRIYRHGRAPQDVAKPYVTWFVAAVGPANNLSSPPGHDLCTVQIDCWHQQDSGVQELAEAVRDAMEQVSHMTGVFSNERDVETKLYRVALQFDYWLPREATSFNS